jgi:hypothetical protein
MVSFVIFTLLDAFPYSFENANPMARAEEVKNVRKT